MASALNLSLPEAPRPRPRPGIVQVLTLLVAAAALILLFRDRKAAGPGPPPADPAEAARLKELATDLERRTLYTQAGEVWREYLGAASLTPQERGELLYRLGKCFKEGGLYGEAARRLSEVDGFPVPRDEKKKAARLLLECLSAMGKHDAREAVARAFAVQEEEKGTVVAKVGGEAITREELRQEISSALVEALKLQGAPLAPAELSLKAAELADQEFKDPEGARRAVSQAVSTRLLHREGLERGFGADAATLEAAARFQRQFVAQRVIDAEVEKALQNLGPTELSNHYEAHKEQYIEKAGAEFSWARFPSQAEAEAAVQELRRAAPEVPLEKAKGTAVEGEPVPGIGPSAEITAHLLALGEGETSDRPIAHQGAFYLFRVDKKRPQRQLGPEEAAPRVRADLAALKRREAMETLRSLLAQKFSVEILDANLAGTPAAAREKEKDAKDSPAPAPSPAKQ